MGIGGVKLLSAQSATATYWNQIIGGAQFDHAFSGCLPSNCTKPPEQDEFDILATFFNGTKAVDGTATFPGLFSGVPGESAVNAPLTNSAPLNFLQVYYQDVLYAETNGCNLDQHQRSPTPGHLGAGSAQPGQRVALHHRPVGVSRAGDSVVSARLHELSSAPLRAAALTPGLISS